MGDEHQYSVIPSISPVEISRSAEVASSASFPQIPDVAMHVDLGPAEPSFDIQTHFTSSVSLNATLTRFVFKSFFRVQDHSDPRTGEVQVH